MSRSWRKRPFLKDSGNSHKDAKVETNRHVRRTAPDLPVKGNHAHRHYDDWMVESRSYMTRRDAERKWDKEELEEGADGYLHRKFVTRERWLAWWKKTYLGK